MTCLYIPSTTVFFEQLAVGELFFISDPQRSWVKFLYQRTDRSNEPLHSENLGLALRYRSSTPSPMLAPIPVKQPVNRATRVTPELLESLANGQSMWKNDGSQVWKIDGQLKTYARGPMVKMTTVPVDALCFVADRLARRRPKGYVPLDAHAFVYCEPEALVQRAIETPTVDDTFEQWADLYLGNFFTKVVNASAQNVDHEMEASFRAAEKQLGRDSLDFTKFLGIEKPTIKLAELEAFIEPVRAIFKAETAMPDGVFDAPYDILEVNPDPIAIESPFQSPEFKRKVLNGLTWCLARGLKSVASFYIAQHFKVNQRDLEHWLDNNPEFICKRGKTAGVFYYSMAKKEGVFPVGSDDFVQQLTQILREDDKPWKSPAFLAQQLGCEEAALIEWADKSPLLTRKPSEKQKDKVYYALVARVGAEVAAPKEEATTVVETPAADPPEPKKPEADKKPKKEKKPENQHKKSSLPSSITDEERFAFAQLHLLCGNLLSVMDFYGNRLAMRHDDAFGHLTRAQKELRAAVALLQAGIKVEDKRLPQIDQL